jgi:hypothetical protein
MPEEPVLSHRETALTYTQQKTEKKTNPKEESCKYAL